MGKQVMESGASCKECSFFHLGDAEQQLREASSATSEERVREKLENAVDAIYQSERRHLGPQYPEKARKTRELRKDIENGNTTIKEAIERINSLRSGLGSPISIESYRG